MGVGSLTGREIGPTMTMTDLARPTRSCPIDVHLPAGFAAEALKHDARRGLAAIPRSIPPKWLYDSVGSALFEQITVLPEYYPTQSEAEILARHAEEICSTAGCDTLVELGSGSSTKTRLLIDAMASTCGLDCYVAVDISEAAIRGAGEGLVREFPNLSVRGLVADFEHQLHLLPREGRRLVAFLGTTIGNLEPPQRHAFLDSVRATLVAGDRFLLGADLIKPTSVLLPAYDDAAGVTAAFNKNILNVLNRGVGASFDPECFDHVALWNENWHWVEMRLRSRCDQTVRVEDLDVTVRLRAGEDIRTEVSTKFSRQGLEEELARVGLAPDGWWTDPGGMCSVSMWRPV